MNEAGTYLKSLLGNLRTIREKAGLSSDELEERLILGPGWISRFETAQVVPGIDMLLAILRQSGATLSDLVGNLPAPDAAEIERFIFAEPQENDLNIHFRYANFDAAYILKNAKIAEFESVIKTLLDGLSGLAGGKKTANEALKSDAVAKAFLKAVELWPDANPSDLWWGLLSIELFAIRTTIRLVLLA